MKKMFLLMLIVILSIFYSSISYCEKISYDLQNNIFRLHIIANSDSILDQEIKLKVRDNLIKYMNSNSNNFININECINHTKNDINNINLVVQNVFDENSYDMNFKTTVTKDFFPTKKYESTTFPTGIYNCLKIQIGENIGENWWCVLYPNLCITDESIKLDENIKLQKNLNSSTYSLVTSKNNSYKFKIVEIYEKIKHKINI